MGVPAALIGGALLGLTLSGSMSKGASSYSSYNSGGNIQYQQENPVATMPEAPEAPVNEDGGKSEAMLAAEEEERKRRAAEAEANRTNFTGGLGLTSTPSLGKNTLLG